MSGEPVHLLSRAPIDWTGGYTYLLPAVRQVLDLGIDVHLRIEATGRREDEEPIRFDIDDLALHDHVVLLTDRPGSGDARPDAVVSTAVAGDPWDWIGDPPPAPHVIVAHVGDLTPRPGVVVVPPRDIDALGRAIAELERH